MTSDDWKSTIASVAKESHAIERDFIPLDAQGADVHGSWVWTCVRQEPLLTRFASFSFTELDENGELSVEVVAGVDTKDGFRKKTLSSFTVPESSIGEQSTRARIAEEVDRATRMALEMRAENLQPRTVSP